MSIQSQIDRITGEVSTQSNLIAQIKSVVDSLPEAGTGSNGGFESNTDVCTITINSDYFIEGLGYYGYMKYNSITGTTGTIHHNSSAIYVSDITICAVCGSVLYYCQNGLYSVDITAGEILEMDATGFVYRVPSTPTNVTITTTTD